MEQSNNPSNNNALLGQLTRKAVRIEINLFADGEVAGGWMDGRKEGGTDEWIGLDAWISLLVVDD